MTLLNNYHDILLVDQRGTGRSKRHHADVTQYGTRMAMEDLDMGLASVPTQIAQRLLEANPLTEKEGFEPSMEEFTPITP